MFCIKDIDTGKFAVLEDDFIIEWVDRTSFATHFESTTVTQNYIARCVMNDNLGIADIDGCYIF